MTVPGDAGTLWVIAGTSFGVGLSGAVSPGPMLVFTIRESLRIGSLAGPLVVAGHAILELAVVLALVWGVSRFLTADPVVAAISIAGGLFLLWMGYGLLRRPGSQLLDAAAEGGSGAWWRTLAGGAVVSLANPFWTIWWATIGLSYLVWAREEGSGGVAAFYGGHIMSDLAWYTLVAVGIAGGRRVLGPGVYRGLLMVCGVFLLGLGAWFLWTGADRALSA